MGFYRGDDGKVRAERRAAARARIDSPAFLRLPTSDRHGRMSDISEGGARLKMADPPQKGTSAFLCWGTHEHFCKVIWATEEACGISFDRPIPVVLIEEISGQAVETGGPVANPGKIPLGRKRSRPLVTG